jgi:hypothetical protein
MVVVAGAYSGGWVSGLGNAMALDSSANAPRREGLTRSCRVRPDVVLRAVELAGLPGARVEVSAGHLVGAQYLGTPGSQPAA